MKRTAKRIVALTTLISFTASNTLAAIPNLQSIQGVNPDGRYNDGDILEITAKFDDFISPSPQSQLSLTLDLGPTTVDVPLSYSSDSLRDTSFGVAGVDNATGYGDANSEGIVMATELKQGDNAGRIVIVGSFTSYEGNSGIAKIVVLNADGTIYKTFANTDAEFTNANIAAVYETSEGKIIVSGEFANAFNNNDYDFLVQLNSDFTLDSDFMDNLTNNSSERGFNGQVGSSGTANGANYYSANTPIVEHNGRLYIGGDFTQVGGEDYDHVTCLNLDGTFCAGFSSPFTLGTRAMSVAVDGDKLWVAGQNMYAGSYQDLWRLNLADGSVDNTYVHRLAGDLIGGIVVLPEIADGGTGGLAVSGNSLNMTAHTSSTDGSSVAAVNDRPLFVINDDGTKNTLWDVQGQVFNDQPWSGEGFQIVKDKLFFGMHYVNNDLSANDIRDSAGYYASLDTVECPRNNVNGSTYTTDTCGLSPLMVFNLNDGSINAEFMDVVGPLGSFLNSRGADDIHDFELLDDGGLLIVGSFGGYRATGTTDAYDESMIVKFRFDQLTGSYTVQDVSTDFTGLVKSTGISNYQVSNIFESTSDTDGDAAYAQLVANNQTLHDNSRYALNRAAASSVELYADDNSNPVPTLTDYSDLGVIGVTAANLDDINAVVDSLEGSDVDTAAKVQQVVDVYTIVAASDDPADGGFTATDLTDIGLTGVSDRQLENYEVAIANASPAPATLAELQAVIDDVNSQLAYPGGVAGTLFWLRADEALLADGSNVTSVRDYNIATRSLSATQGGGVTFDATLQNFNPGYVSDGTDLFISQDSWIMTGNGDRSAYIVGSTANSADGWSYIFGMGSGNPGESFDFGKVFGSEQLIATAHNGFAPIDNIWITDQVSFAYAQYDNSIPELAASGNGSAFTRINETTNSTQKLSLFAGSRNNETWNGSVGEVIIWEKVLTDNERQRVDSYLAVKFGITLNQDGAGTEDGDYLASDSAVIWDETIAAGYSNDIFGLGKDIGSDLNQKISKSVNANTVLTLATSADFTTSNLDASRTTIAGDRSFIMLSNNGAAPTMQNTEKSVDYLERTSREWLVQRSGYAQALSMKFDGFGSTAVTSYVVLADADGDFSAGSTVLGSLDANGEVTLTDAQVQNLASGSYITVAVIDQDVLASNQALAEVLEDSNSVGGADNANGTAVTIAQLNDIQGLTNLIAGNEAAYQAAINAETGFSNPPTVAEVQAIIDAVNASANVLQQIGNEADNPDAVDSTVTVTQLQTIVPAITGLVAGNEALYQDYIDENPASFSSPATAAEVQDMVDAVNSAVTTSNSVLAQIGNEGDNPDVVNSVITVAQIETIIPEITGVVAGNEALYQDYIDANPDSFSAPATAAEVQAMITAVNDAVTASNAVLTQIGNEGDEPDTVTSVVTVAQMQTIIPEITGLDANNQSLYQNYIDENPGSFSAPATAAEVQAMVDAVNDAVNTSNSVLAQIGNEGDNPDVVDSVVTVAQIQTIIPEITGVIAGNEALYQNYIDENPDAISAPATAAEVQAVIDAVNAAVATSTSVLAQIGNEGDNPDVVDSVVTVAQIQSIIPEITGVVAGNEALYQDYIDANPDSFSAPATAAEVQAMITAVNDAVTTSNDVLTQIGNEGDNPDVVDSVVTVAQIQTIIPEITGADIANEALYQNYIDENPDAFSAPATAAEVQSMINAVNGGVSDSTSVLVQIGNEADEPDVVDSVVTVTQLQQIIPALTGLVPGNEAEYQNYIDANPTLFSASATAAEVQDMVDAVNTAVTTSNSVLTQIGNEGDNPDVVDSVVTVAQIQTIIPEITGVVAGNEALYQDYIDANPDSFSAPATAAEVQAMITAVNDAVNTSDSVLAQIGNEGDNPDAVNSVVTVAQIQTIIPEITGVVAGNEALYQDYIDENPDSFSAPATAAEVQAMITAVNDAVNTSNSVLAQIGNEGDNPDSVNSVVTVAQIQTIIPEITGVVAGNEALYQDYIDDNPDSFSAPATAAEVQSMIDNVNAAVATSTSVLEQIGNEGDNPDVVNSVVTVSQIQSIIPEITGVVAGNEALYQDYIDESPDSFSAPATAAEVQAMITAVNDAVNTSNSVLAQIGTEGDNPDVVDSVVTVAQIQTIIPEITGVVAGNEALYQNYIDENPDAFSAPATATEVQNMVSIVNASSATSESVLAQIGNEADDPDVVDSVVTVPQMQQIIPEITGLVPANQAEYQNYIDNNPNAISSPATAAEVQDVIDAVNAAVAVSDTVLAQIGNEGDNPDVVNSVVTVAQIETILPTITGVVAGNEALYQDYIDANPDSFSAPATAAEVQAMINNVNAAVNTSTSVLEQIGNEGDNPDVVNSVVTVPQLASIIPEITGLVPGNEAEYQNYIDANPDAFSAPATAAEVQDLVDTVNAAVATSTSVLAQIGNEGDNPDVVDSVVTVAQMQTIIPEITGLIAGNEALYQDYIDANPDSFSAPATAAEVQSMVTTVNADSSTSESVLAQIGNEADNPDVVDSVVTVPQLQQIIPAITGLVPANEAEYQNYIDENPDAFSSPATAAEVQDLIDTVNAAVNTSDSVLAQIGNEGDNPDVVDSVVTVAQIQTIIPEITGVVAANEALYQDYIDENPDSFSAPATAAEVQSMITNVNNAVNTSTSVLEQIGNEGDNPDVVNSVVTVPQLASIIPEITGLVPANEAEYQNYIDENPDAISAPATAAEVQDVIDAVNAAVATSTSVLAQIGNEGDNPDVVDSVVTVAQMQTIIPEITGLIAGNEGLYQDYIDANPDNFSAPATAAEVQAMVNAVNATTSSSASVLAQIGNEGDNPDVVDSVVTVAQMQQIIPAIIGLVGAQQALYQDYIDENPDSFSAPATAAEVQSMVTTVNDAVSTSNSVLAQIGSEGDNPDVVDSVVTVTQIEQIIPEITGVVAANEALYQDYIDENPDRFSVPATASQVQLMVDAVNEAVNDSDSALAQIGREGDDPDTVNSEISVAQMQQIIPEITGLLSANQSLYQDYIDANPDSFSAPATAAEVQSMVDAVNAAVIQSATILAQIGNEADSPDNVESVVTVEQLRQILPALDGVTDDNEALYQAYIDSRPNAFSEPATVGQVQIMIDRVNASQEALLEILEDSASEDGSNNANGEAVTVQEIASITGITGVNFDLEDEYQSAIAAETGFSNPPTLAQVQAIIDQVNADNTNQAPGNTGSEETTPDGTLEFSKSAGSVSLLWIMLAMLLVLARVQPRGLLNAVRNRRWLAPAAALLAVSSASVAEESTGIESLWVSVPASEKATTPEATEESLAENKRAAGQAEEISRLYLTGGGLYSQFSPDSDGVEITSESDAGLGLGLGYDITDQLSVEASYLSHGEFRVENNADNNEAALDYSSANIRLNWFPKFIGNKERHAGFSRDGVLSWYLSAGLNYVMGDVTGPVDIDKDQSVVLGYGAGIAYGVTDQLDTFLSYNRISGDLDAISAGVRFHFGLEQPAGRSVPLAVPTVTAFVEPTVLSTPQPEMAVLPDCVSCTPVGSVFFAFDSSAISDEFHPMLEELLQRISNDEFRGSILITGFADSLGSSDYNLALAHRRAKAVSDYLVEHGLDRFLIDVESEGRLLTPNILEASKRRADIFVKNADMTPVSWID